MIPPSSRKRVASLALIVLILAGFFLVRRTATKSVIEKTPVIATQAFRAKAARSASVAADEAGRAETPAVGDAAPASAAAFDPKALYQQTLKALNEPISTERWMRFASILQNLSPANWLGVLQALDDERKLHGRDHADARAFFVRRAGEVIGLDAVTYFLDAKETAAARSALTGWASKSPAEALNWLAKQSSETGHAVFVGDAIRGLALVEPDLAVSFLENVPIADRKKYTPDLVSTLVRSAGLEQAQKLVDDMITRAGAEGTLRESYLAQVFRDLAEIKAKRANISGNIEPTMDWLNQHVGQPYLDGFAMRNAAAQFANQDPLKTIAWLDDVNARAKFPPFTAVGYGYVMDVWTSKAGLEPAAEWLSNNSTHPSYDRIASHYAGLAVAKDPNLADQVARSIKDPAIRTAALGQIQKARVAAAARKK